MIINEECLTAELLVSIEEAKSFQGGLKKLLAIRMGPFLDKFVEEFEELENQGVQFDLFQFNIRAGEQIESD